MTAARARPRWGLRIVALLIVVLSSILSLWQLPADLSLSAVARTMFVAAVAAYLTVAVLIVERRPGNPVGWVLFAMGVLTGLYVILDVLINRDSTGAAVAAWLVSLMDAPLFFLVSLLFLLFPDGRLPSVRWRPLVLVDVVLVAIVLVSTAVRPGPFTFYTQFDNPFGRPDAPLAAISETAYVLLVVSVALSAASLIGRWRRGNALERAQLKWIASVAVFAAVVMGSYGVIAGPGAYNLVMDFLVSVALSLFPIAVGVAILRYRLFEIDRIVSRTIAYGLIIGLLVATYAAAILILQGPLGTVLGGDTVSVALSTLVVAALFQPLRRRTKRIVDHRFDRARFDGERTAAAFSERLRDEVDIATVTADLDRTVRAVLKPTMLVLWLRGPVA